MDPVTQADSEMSVSCKMSRSQDNMDKYSQNSSNLILWFWDFLKMSQGCGSFYKRTDQCGLRCVCID